MVLHCLFYAAGYNRISPFAFPNVTPAPAEHDYSRQHKTNNAAPHCRLTLTLFTIIRTIQSTCRLDKIHALRMSYLLWTTQLTVKIPTMRILQLSWTVTLRTTTVLQVVRVISVDWCKFSDKPDITFPEWTINVHDIY